MLAAAFGVCTPTLARAEDVASLANAVNALASTDPAAAARLAAAGAARGDLDDATRVLLGGLAYGNFKRAYEADKTGGDLADLCGLADVMRLVAPLDDDAAAAQVKLDAAAQAEASLKAAAGDGWRRVCDGVPVLADEPVAVTTQPQPQPQPAMSHPPTPPTDTVAHRRFRTGVGTLTSGLVLFAPMAAILAYRTQGERDLWALEVTTDAREATEAETRQAASLLQRYQATTAGAAALGVTGAALAVTGVVLLATGRRPSRVAVAPWGARGIGGLLFEGRF